MRFALLLPAALAALALTGCALEDDGPRRTESRDVAAFTRVESDGSVDVRLHVGEQRHLQVRAGEKVIGAVGTEVRDGTLHVTFDHDGWGGNDVVVEASVPKLEGIESSGSGDIEADGIDADAFELSSDGSADLVLTGTVDALDVEVEVEGSGDVRYHGDPELTQRVDGSGDLSRAES